MKQEDAMAAAPLEQALDARVAEILERCTSCGACVDVCPMPGPAGIDASDSSALASGVLATPAATAGTRLADVPGSGR